MEDAFAYCAELVRKVDRDRFIAALFAPPQHRGALHALYAFNAEVTRVRDVAHAALPGEIRLQWWSEVIDGERGGEASANPVAAALLATIHRYRLSPDRLAELIEAHRFDLYDDPMASIADLKSYAMRSSSAIFSCATRILTGMDAETVCLPAGIAYGLTVTLRDFPHHAARRQLYVPVDLLERHQVRLHDLFAGCSSAGLKATLAELRSLARAELRAAGSLSAALPREARPALLPLALVRPTLDRLERSEPFAPVELPPWRRQWLIWRASRNLARIAN